MADDPLLPPPPGAEFDLPPPDVESEPSPVRPSVSSNPFLARAQKFGVKGGGGGSASPRAEPVEEPEPVPVKKAPVKASNPYKGGGGGGGGVKNPYSRAVVPQDDEPAPATVLQNPYSERQSVARKPTEIKSTPAYGGGGYGGGGGGGYGGDDGGDGGDDELPPPPGGDDGDDEPAPTSSYKASPQPKASIASPYSSQPKASIASPYSATKSPSQAYSPPPPADDDPPAEDPDPEETERKQRIIDKIKKQQAAFQAGIISGGDPKLVAASMAPPVTEPKGGRGMGRPGTGDDLPYIADDGKGPWCAFCGATLKGQQVMEVGGKEYHPRCFVCAQCRKPLTGQMLTVQERYYHPGCLQCKSCGQALNGKQFVVNPSNKQVYCPEHGRLDKGGSGLKCAGCKDPISGKEPVVNALQNSWHQMCFVCDNCRETLVGQACVAQKGKPYCEGCYEQLFRTKCNACQGIIDGQVLELGNEGSAVSYHPACFKCHTCSKPLKGSPFYLKGPGVYCEAHALD